MKKIFFLFCFLSSISSFSQINNYTPHLLITKHYDWGGNDKVWGLVINNHNIVLSGTSASSGVVMSVNNNGDSIWAWRGEQGSSVGYITVLPDSNYLFPYNTFSKGTEGKIVCISKDGVFLWQKTIGSNKNFLLCNDTINKRIATVGFNTNLLKILDYQGNQIDSLTLDVNVYNHKNISLNGNSIIVSGLGVGGVNWNVHSYIAKYHKTNGIWEKTWHNIIVDGSDTRHTIDDSGYIYLGTTKLYTYNSFIVQKITQYGSIEWSKEWVHPDSMLSNYVHDVILLPDNKGFITAGNLYFANYTYTGFIRAYDLEGNYIFQILSSFSNNINIFDCAYFDSEKRLVLAGQTYIPSINENNIQLQIWSIDGITDVQTLFPVLPNVITLHHNYPNPFNPSTTISYDLPSDDFVTLKIYDVLGNLIDTIVEEYQQAGFHSKLFIVNSSLSSGMYFYTLQSGNKILTNKMILIK